ncbi:MAG: SDR family oxidoreductase [Magnetococcales bacterium]|nr:SDR family oxidoreductase [Magnetococcales bacterium]
MSKSRLNGSEATRTIVITGALGHIGSRLIQALPRQFPDAKFVLLDNLSTQRYPSLFSLPSSVDFSFVNADIVSCSLERVLAGANTVIHLAAITDATSSFDNKDEMDQVNYRGTERLAQACVATGTSLIYPSSTSVYGTEKDWVNEDCGPEDLQPQSPYAESKLREEELLQRLGKDEGLKYVTFRLGTIFGISPGMRFHTAVNKFCWQAVMGEPLTVWKTAYNQSRPYLDLDDAVRAIAFLLERNQFTGELYNVLSANATVGEIVDIIRSVIPSLEVTLVEAKIMNKLSYEVSDEKFRAIGFKPIGDLKRSINDTINLLRGANSSFSSLLKDG